MCTSNEDENQAIKPSNEFNYYAGEIYWNDFNKINQMHNFLISGNTNINWRQHLKSKYGSCDTGLFVQCGNGWVERDFFRDGIIKRVIGSDISEELLKGARQEAERINMPATYHVLDSNKADFEDYEANWVINHAAFHHIAFIDHAVRKIAKMLLRKDGLLVCFDYIGPHRNQYPFVHWSIVLETNNMLPNEYQVDLRYPHLPTMLWSDPTEAIHSELILQTIERYFEIQEFVPLGGAIAYPLLFRNNKLHANQDTKIGQQIIDIIIEQDKLVTASSQRNSYFAYLVAKPSLNAFDDENQLRMWEEENNREAMATQNNGRYGKKLALEIIYNEISDLRDKIKSI